MKERKKKKIYYKNEENERRKITDYLSKEEKVYTNHETKSRRGEEANIYDKA